MNLTLYRERYRPRVHFTAKAGWLNDPNGLVFHAGEYHLFFQHNPFGTDWGNMTWGHAVSADLVHWRQLPNAIEPYDGGTIFSGSAVADSANSSGLGKGGAGPLIAVFSHARQPFGQALAFSHGCGRTWTLYDGGRHVVPNQGLDASERDPRVLWHAPTGRWVMVLWVARGVARFFVSADLIRWEHASDFAGVDFLECPDLFELPVEGRSGVTRWVLHHASFRYWVGDFDGRRFHADGGPFTGDHGPNFYAPQTWTGLPGRVVQIGWMRGGSYPGMPFNQQMSFPCELSLRETADGLRLCRQPVAELEGLREEVVFHGCPPSTAVVNPLEGIEGEAFDLRLTADARHRDPIEVAAYGQVISCVPGGGKVVCGGKETPLPAADDGALDLRVLIDRTSVEVFAGRGRLSVSWCFVPPAETAGLRVTGGAGAIRDLTVCRLRSMWEGIE